jgi:hypothetical protein
MAMIHCVLAALYSMFAAPVFSRIAILSSRDLLTDGARCSDACREVLALTTRLARRAGGQCQIRRAVDLPLRP